jgi:5-methylcytosine-specific restriction endonuclease McrA
VNSITNSFSIFFPVVEGIMSNLVGIMSGVEARKEKLAELGRKSVLPLEGRRFGRLMVVSRAGSKWKKALWLCRCDCGNEKVILSRALVSGSTRSCGCYHKEVWQELLRNPDLTDEERELRRERRVDPRTVEWRKKVYERDGYVCQACGDGRGGNLVAHHKESWDRNKELRFDVANGTTSCEPCHKEFHSVFGYGGNTAEEWDQFLRSKGAFGVKFERPVKVSVRIVDLVGRKFGRLTVVGLDVGAKPLRWICQCDCGEVKSVDGHGLKRGRVVSCGCVRREQAGEMGRRNKRAA